MQEPTRTTLAYARRSKRQRFWWAAGALAVLAIAVALWWGPTWRRQAAMLIDQRRCMTYRAPPGQVVYEGRRDENGICEKVTTCYSPRCWTRLLKRRTSPAAVAFLHERTSPSGNRRLVCIAAEPILGGTLAGLSVRPEWNFRVMFPAKLVGGPADVPVFPYLEDDFLIGVDRVYAGQPDPADPSHFMIQYDDEDGRHMVDGWFRDDDTLKFRVRGVENAE